MNLGHTYEGPIDGRGRRVAIAASRFNRLVTDPLVAGAVSELRRHGVAEADIDLAWVPGAFELPLAAERLAATGRYAATAEFGMAGAWQLALEWDGPAGRGSVTFEGNVQ